MGDKKMGGGGSVGKRRPARIAASNGGNNTAACSYNATRPSDAMGSVNSSIGVPLLGPMSVGQHASHACTLLALHGGTPASLSRYTISHYCQHTGVDLAQKSAVSNCQSLRYWWPVAVAAAAASHTAQVSRRVLAGDCIERAPSHAHTRACQPAGQCARRAARVPCQGQRLPT